MENRDWMILKVLYKEKNITKTAEVLFMTQPAMTKRLQQIEKEFGVEIVHRGKRGVYFTPQGEYLAKCADRMLVTLREISDNLSNMEDSIEGLLRIGASRFVTMYKLPEILSSFKKKYPKVEFKVTTGWSSDIFNLLYNQEVQIAFIRGNYNWHEHKHLLLEENLCVVSAQKISLPDLPRLQRVEYNMDYKLKELISNWWWENYSQPPLICMEVDKSDTCRKMVNKGLGYAIMPSLLLENTNNLYKIDITNKDGTLIKRNTWMFYYDEFLQLKLVKTFVDFVKNGN